MLRVSSSPNQRQSKYATVNGMWMFLNVFGIAVGGAYGLIWAIAGLHAR